MRSDDSQLGDLLADEAPRGEAYWRRQYVQIAQLAGRLAHEVKNPLSTIGLNIELLLEEFGQSDSPRDRRTVQKLQTVQQECQRLADLLDDFLSFAKPTRLRLEPHDLNQVVQRTLEFFSPKCRAAGIETVRYLDPEVPSVLLDREKFEAALLNLLLNAQQAMPEGGQLVVRTRPTLRGVALDLIDTGVGIEEHALPRIFEPFYTTKREGSGLGLPTVAKIIEAHQGTIDVQSRVGVGTQVTIELPAPPRLTVSSG